MSAPENTTLTLSAVRAAAESRIPVMIVGAPGVGKTATIRALADSMGYKLITILGSQMDPTDVAGLPAREKIFEDESGVAFYGTTYSMPWWQVEIIRHKKVMLFFDEFSNTSSAVRASMLTMLQNREFPNGMVMPDETIVLGAMNPTEQAADGWELDKPTTNRMMFLKWEVSDADWFAGMLTAWGAPMDKEEAYWRKLIVKFLEDKVSFIHRENGDLGTTEAYGVNMDDPSAVEVLRYAWASRRSWDNVAKILSKVDRKAVLLQDEIIGGTVGRAAGVAFREWIQKHSIVSPKEVLQDPTIVDWDDVEVSEANIILKEISEIVGKTNWREAGALMTHIAEQDAHALTGAYLKPIVASIMRGGREAGHADEAKALATSVVKMYGKVKPTTAR